MNFVELRDVRFRGLSECDIDFLEGIMEDL